MGVTAKDSTVPKIEDFKELHNLVTHHIESMDYMADKGLDVMFNRIKPVSIYDSVSGNELNNILFLIPFIVTVCTLVLVS